MAFGSDASLRRIDETLIRKAVEIAEVESFAGSELQKNGQ